MVFYFVGNFSEIPYEIKTLREDAHAAVRKMSPYGDQRRRAKSVKLPSGMRGWGSRSLLADFVLFAYGSMTFNHNEAQCMF